MTRTAIIGAGIAGLTLAKELKGKGCDVVVFEKARGPGGRTSTRRGETSQGLSFKIDHGAQFFTARSPEFQRFLDKNCAIDTVREWGGNFQNWSDGELSLAEGKMRLVAVPGINQITKDLSQSCDIRSAVRIHRLERRDDEWQLWDEQENDQGCFDRVISTAPPQQTADLFSGVVPCAQDIETIAMKPCITLMLAGDEDIDLDVNAVSFEGHPVLGWFAKNHSKPGERGDAYSFTIQANAQWSDIYKDDARDLDKKNRVAQDIKSALEDALGVAFKGIGYENLHGWLYASAYKREGQLPYFWDESLQIGACGDWCMGPRIECAFLSAYELDKIL
jgi:renalase